MSQKIFNFLGLALDDYRAARLLLRQGLLAQGVALASTAVEKELKAVLALKNYFTKKHLDSGLLATAEKFYSGLTDALDKDFIKFLGKGFDLRYAAVDSAGYQIVINQNRTLVALDFTMMTLDYGVALQRDGVPHLTPLRQAIESNDALIIQDNVFLKNVTQEEMFGRSNKMFELRVGSDLQTLTAAYETEGLNIIGLFCKKTDMDFNKKEFKLALG